MFCEKCGGKVNLEDKVCMYCGYMLKNETINSSRDRNQMPPRDRNQVPPRDRNQMPPRDRNQVPPRDRNQMPPRDRNQMPPRDRNQMPSRDRNQMPSRDRNQMPSRDRNQVPARGRNQVPPREKSVEHISPIWNVANAVFAILIVGCIGIGGWFYFNPGTKLQVQEPRESEETLYVEETALAIDTVIVMEKTGGTAVVETEEVAETLETSDDYMFPNGDSSYITVSELQGLSKDELRIARNEFYARHGRIFTDQELQEYFESKSWYVPQYEAEEMDALGLSIFNEYEIANIELITEMEASID